MIAYLDTSALLKLYFSESGAADMDAAVARASSVSTSLLTYVEARSAFARKRHNEEITALEYRQMLAKFESDWQRFFVIAVDEDAVQRAAVLTEAQNLRAADAVHLASAKAVQRASKADVVFYVADRALERAAKAEGLAAALVGV